MPATWRMHLPKQQVLAALIEKQNHIDVRFRKRGLPATLPANWPASIAFQNENSNKSCMTCVLVFVLLAVGPHLDPLRGESLEASDRDVLPAAYHLADAVDMWMPHMVNLASSGGGIDAFDAVRLSAHGFSTQQLAFAWGHADLTDPARPGEPIFQMPFELWRSLHFASLWSHQPRLTWSIEKPIDAPLGMHVSTKKSFPVGGSLWLPAGFMDREPAFDFGAPHQRRGLRNAEDIFAEITIPMHDGQAFLAVEHLSHTHQYLTQTPYDAAQRETIVGYLTRKISHGNLDLRLLYQGNHRSHDGAQYRWPLFLTRQNDGHAIFAQAHVSHRLGTGGLQMGWAWSGRQDTSHMQSNKPWLTDLEDEWLWMARPTLPGTLRRQKHHLYALWDIGSEALPLRLNVQGQIARIYPTWDLLGQRFGTTYRQAPVFQTALATKAPRPRSLQNWSLGADLHTLAGAWTFDATAGLHLSAAGADAGAQWMRISPSVGAAATWSTRPGQWFVLVRREPETLTAQVADFLDTQAAATTQTAWHDDNADGIVQPSEIGELLRVAGGPSHQRAEALALPASHQLALGYRSPLFGPWQWRISAIGRWTLGRLTVESSSDGYTAKPFFDPGGDGRGETRSVLGSGQDMTSYAADLRQTATAPFFLRNDPKAAYYLGIETSLLTQKTRFWFVNIGGAAYLSAGAAPFGNFVDRNDPGVISEASANLNQQINAWGRYEHDRSFSLKILAGILPLEGLSLATAARYRDGEPFARIVIDPDLPQGPTALMAIRRGRARATFHMNWDVRVRYQTPKSWPVAATLICDVYNLFGSATELIEDARTGPGYRKALEAIPNRTLFLGLEFSWQQMGRSQA